MKCVIMCVQYSCISIQCVQYTCHERPPPVRSESGASWQVAAGHRYINKAKPVVGALQKWPAKAGGRSPKGPAEAGTMVPPSSRYPRGMVSTHGRVPYRRINTV